MTTADDAFAPRTVKVWDPFVRIFHWSLVAAVFGAFLTGEDMTRAHIRIGWFVVALIGARLVWGVIGTRHARFVDFVKGPRSVLRFLGETVRWRAERHLGHNPAGGAMVVTLLILLAAIGASGWAMTTDAGFGDETLELLHVSLAYATLGLVVLHVAGVVLASLEHRENLVVSMFTGRKRA